MKTATKQLDAKERILQKATELFYRQGYYQTGINQIIDEADVSKATFYSHFPSKDDLALAYIQFQHRNSMELIKEGLKKLNTPRDRFLMIAQGLREWMISTNFRGCEFLNITSEIIDSNHPVRKEVKYHMDAIQSLLKDLAEDLIKSDPVKYKNFDATDLARKYFVIFNGGLAGSAEYHDIWPMDVAAEQVENLIK